MADGVFMVKDWTGTTNVLCATRELAERYAAGQIENGYPSEVSGWPKLENVV